MARVPASLLAACAAAAVFASAAPAYATAAPTTVTGLTSTPGDSQVALAWTNPADADFAGVTVVKKTGTTPPATIVDGTTVYAGVAQHAVASGLTNGSAYSFGVFTRNIDGDTSAPATLTDTPVPALATALTGVAAPATVTYSQHVLLTGTLRRSDTNEVLTDATVDVYRKIYGQAAFSRVYRLKTNTAGIATYKSLAMVKKTEWYLDHPADPYLGASTSPTLTSLVRPRLTYALSATTVEQNVAAVLNVTIAPNHSGDTMALQQYVGGAWQNVAYRKLTPTSHISIGIATSAIGTKVFRMYKPHDGDHVTVYSPKFAITTVTRTLRAGMSGADVTAAQRRLAALHYDPGTINGYFGFDTVHATAAFQKVNGLAVNGTVDPATHARLAKPKAPTLRYPRAGTWVEVDLTKQVLYYGRDKAVVRILDVSSGSGNYFTVDGITQRAVTPMGSFHVFHKIDGLRTSRLGELWRPAYFASGGYAIHGNGSVPFYPASHGCIRITVPAMNRLFAMLTIGLPVYVYRN